MAGGGLGQRSSEVKALGGSTGAAFRPSAARGGLGGWRIWPGTSVGSQGPKCVGETLA